MKSFGNEHTSTSHIPKFAPKLPKMDFFYIFSDSVVNELKEAFWSCISTLYIRYKYAFVSCRSLGPPSINNITQYIEQCWKKSSNYPGHVSNCLWLLIAKGVFQIFVIKKQNSRLFLIQETFIAFYIFYFLWKFMKFQN